MAATITRPYSAEPMDVDAWAATSDTYPTSGSVAATLMALPEWRAVPGQLWEREAERSAEHDARRDRWMDLELEGAA
ncbi:hypothetical protein SEA_GRETCHEN_54 [Microbacterium phage Gretchen]|uniref:Uncharacterized protein n=1 Tax=Microbacterium phage Percival TaxID=2201439 RepID=A0A2Z4Q6P1_9CAUD|nr:hypothetical protein PBI_PERCIVAL_55 [Microbacterium phage Percival]UDL14828.1 hypothetical protein SEA_GRETCHEN_54 [Microbacterium phage Gretchen]